MARYTGIEIIKGLCEQSREWLQINNVNQFACWLNHYTAPTLDVTVIAWLRDNRVREDSRDSFSIFTPVYLSMMRASPHGLNL